jgi:hypothetical protein
MEVVFVMFDQLIPPSSDDCQRIIFPVFPLSVNVPLLVPGHTVVVPVTEPPTVIGFTVIVAAEAVTEGQVPLVTVAL